MGRKLIDLTGQRFGKLVVTRLAWKDARQPLWECQCDCGNARVVEGQNLRSGGTTSCGCVRRENMRRIGAAIAADLTGQRFGRLVALRTTATDRKQGRLWECACDCGGTKQVAAKNLIGGGTRSCGCLQREHLDRLHGKHERTSP